MSTPPDDNETPPKRSNSQSPGTITSNKRVCISHSHSPPTIQTILHLPDDAVWSLRKAELRDYFFQLRQYALNPYPLPIPSQRSTLPSPTSSSPSTTSPLLLLPLEIRLQIYTHLLPPPTPPSSPIVGPHPRSLQSALLLTQPIPSALLALSHQIRSEALPIVWGCPTQVVHISIDYAIWKHKTLRSELVLGREVVSAIRHVHVRVQLGSEKVRSRPNGVERGARVGEVRKGIRKVGKWLSGADIQTLRVSWQEPPQTYTWEQKREILDGFKVLGALKVDAGEINWGLGVNYNKGRKYRFEIEYLKELERGHKDDGSM